MRAALQLLDEQFQGPALELAELPHGGQGRGEASGLRNLVEADDADVAPDRATGGAPGAQRAEGRAVVGAEDGGNVAKFGDPEAFLVAGARALQPSRSTSRQKPRKPFAVIMPGRTR
ncbi:hypothetical protein VR46_34725 [Streptomyces sp. NRRL S-444]|nr:hypothetical protein VR46_34725 [Streptomyces sp. NRRL S-444]